MRKRKRDWPLTVYKFWIRPDSLPKSLYDTADKMRILWNKLFKLYDDAYFAKDTLPDLDIKKLWLDVEKGAKDFVSESGLNWECGPEVLDRFKAARFRAFNAIKNGVPFYEAGFPKFKNDIDHIAIPHRYTGGGIPISKLFSYPSNNRFALESVSDEAYLNKTRSATRSRATVGSFKIDKDLIYFRTVLHRPLPRVGFVKKVAFLGRKCITQEWQWGIAITIEYPSVVSSHTDGIASIDLGWRKMKGYIRIGMLFDGYRFFEFRLPLDLSNYKTRRHNVPSSFIDLIKMDRTISKHFNYAKEKVKNILLKNILPEDFDKEFNWLHNPKAYQKMGRRGMVKVFKYVNEHMPDTEIAEILRTWFLENRKMYLQRNMLMDHIVARRTWYYGNVGSWIAKNFGTVAIESPLDIKKMIEADLPKGTSKDAFIRKRANRHHQWSATSKFALSFKNAIQKSGGKIIEINPKNTTKQCSICGEMTQKNIGLVRICPKGHRWDRDINATKNIFSQMMAESEQKPILRKSFSGKSLQSPEIPSILTAVIREVHPL